MRVKRVIIVPAILALSLGSILAGSAMPAAAAAAPSVHVSAVHYYE
jgi:hypothetical protein